MCGIAGAINISSEPIAGLTSRLLAMSELIKHRGPDGEGIWSSARREIGLAHRRLSIIDVDHGSQPMTDGHGNWIIFNGEIYNYIELREKIGEEHFKTHSDTEVILQAYRKWGRDCVNQLRGMFAFAIWDEQRRELFCARDRFGIKPFYYTIVDNVLYFASEIKGLLPVIKRVETDLAGIKDYFAFQFCLDGKTLFKGVQELLPAHRLVVSDGKVKIDRYWEVYYNLDFDHTDCYFKERVADLIKESVQLHMRADVPVGAYISGGLDSSIIASLASQQSPDDFIGFTGKFTYGHGFDESEYARDLAQMRGFPLEEVDITVGDFIDNISKVIYHLDYPIAGPGSFPQYMVSQLAAKSRKVVLGGQGGDEIFGGYTRYLIAYFEQCIKAAIDGTSHNGNFVVTYESIIPNLTSLRNYKPLLKQFWSEGLFEDIDKRYFQLINRAPQLGNEIRWDVLGDYDSFSTFKQLFFASNVREESYFDLMTHFDFKTLLPALLHVEDRVSMAHGLESRVPLLDHPLVELAATIPADIKFKAGTMKGVLREAMRSELPDSIVKRKDKMGFPVPLTDWMNGEARQFVCDIFSSEKARQRDLIDNKIVLEGLHNETQFGRKYWGLLSLELWQREFHDKAHEYRKSVEREEILV